MTKVIRLTIITTPSKLLRRNGNCNVLKSNQEFSKALLIHREESVDPKPKVEYSLTEFGKS